jgi:hypothetical protein
MVKVLAGSDAKATFITGHGINFAKPYELGSGISIEPDAPEFELQQAADGCDHIHEYAAVLSMKNMATFSLKIEDEAGGRRLATKAWNALWQFNLLSLACATPCFPLYSMSGEAKPRFSIANRNLVIHPLREIHNAIDSQVQWATTFQSNYDILLNKARFMTSLRYFSNSHYLFDTDARIMLLWAGIEGLLDVDSELRRRLALYASILFDGTAAEKYVYFEQVKKSYDVRSKVVHGGGATPEKLSEGYRFASQVLVRLLVKCVELGRVPTPSELDQAAVSFALS